MTEALLHHLYIQHPDHVITVRPPSMRIDGTGPTAGYLFCRDCDGDVDLSAPCPLCDPAIARLTELERFVAYVADGPAESPWQEARRLLGRADLR